MWTSADDLVRDIHSTNIRLVLAVTGGGSESIVRLLRVPGASRTVLEAVIPYSSQALENFLGGSLDQACNETTARAMAMTAFQRAVALCPAETENLVGIACTASLVSDRAKRGAHRVHVAVQASNFTETATLPLTKGLRSRVAEEQIAGQLILQRLAIACGFASHLELTLLEDEAVHVTKTDAPDDWRDLLLGRVNAVFASGPDGDKDRLHSHLIFPGAFHPLHDGHLRMAQIAAQQLGSNVEYELSIVNVDKPMLDFTEIAMRLAQFKDGQALWLTNAATFVEKARIFSGATFVVGLDTLIRIAQSKYYGGSDVQRDSAIRETVERECRFLVFGRITDRGFETLDDIPLPPQLRAICEGITEDQFRWDISSTEVRSRGFSED